MSFTVTPDNPGVPLIENGQAVHGKIQSQHLPFFPAGKRVTEDCGRQLRAWARGESTSVQPATSPRQADTGAGPRSSSQEPAPNVSRELLAEYDQKLSAEVDRDALAAAHEAFKPRFADVNAAGAAIARQILNAHSQRIRGDADADSTAIYVTGLLDEIGEPA